MRYLKILLTALVFGLVAAAFDYNLPSTNIVQVVGTEVVRTDIGQRSFFWASADSGTGGETGSTNRDIRFINTVLADERPRVFRNEDTGIFGWPPYFKISSGNLQAAAQSYVEDKGWVAVKHYGWRIEYLSAYPNAVSIRPVAGPGDTSTNWTRIIAAILLAISALIVWRLLVRLRSWSSERLDRLRSSRLWPSRRRQ